MLCLILMWYSSQSMYASLTLSLFIYIYNSLTSAVQHTCVYVASKKKRVGNVSPVKERDTHHPTDTFPLTYDTFYVATWLKKVINERSYVTMSTYLAMYMDGAILHIH